MGLVGGVSWSFFCGCLLLSFVGFSGGAALRPVGVGDRRWKASGYVKAVLELGWVWAGLGLAYVLYGQAFWIWA